MKFYYADRSLPLKGKRVVQGFIPQLFVEEKVALDELNYIFCSDEYLLEINRSFLSHDDFTDIITFDLSEGDGVKGEVYISLDRVCDNAKEQGVSFREEVLRVLFHGALHLCGYRDKKKSEITIMRQKEEYYLRLFGAK